MKIFTTECERKRGMGRKNKADRISRGNKVKSKSRRHNMTMRRESKVEESICRAKKVKKVRIERGK